MKKGEIFECYDFTHYFVYLYDIDENSFKEIMLTSSESYIEDNVPIKIQILDIPADVSYALEI
jgi:hypothetical protein